MPQAANVRPAHLHLCRFRAVRLAATGAPLTGATSAYTSGRAMNLDVSIEADDGEEKELVNGCNGIDVQYREPDRFRRYTFTLNFTTYEPRLIELMTGATLLLDSSTVPVPRGFNNPKTTQANPPDVAIDAYSDAYEGGAQAPSPFAFFRRIFPKTRWRLADDTLDGDPHGMSLVGYSLPNPGWGIGLGDQGGAIDENGAVLFQDTMPADSNGAYVAVP